MKDQETLTLTFFLTMYYIAELSRSLYFLIDMLKVQVWLRKQCKSPSTEVLCDLA